MSDIGRLDERIDRIDDRTQRIEQKIFNGMSDALKALEHKLPELMTKADHEAIERAKLDEMRRMGERKDRTLRWTLGIIGALLTLTTARPWEWFG